MRKIFATRKAANSYISHMKKISGHKYRWYYTALDNGRYEVRKNKLWYYPSYQRSLIKTKRG